MKGLYINKLNIVCNQTLDPKGGDIIKDRIILPMLGFETNVLMNSPLGKIDLLYGRAPCEYSEEILDGDAHLHHCIMVFSVLHHKGYV